MDRNQSEDDIPALAGRLQACGANMSARELGQTIDALAATPASMGSPPLPAFANLAEPERAILDAAVERRRLRYPRAFRPCDPSRVASLRAELRRQGLDGLIVPRADEHQGEYVSLRAERLAWLTGFTGSAGLAIVLAESAAVFVDGRYTLQVRGEVDAGAFEYRHLLDEPPAEWIAAHLVRGGRLGYDPWHLSPAQVERYEAATAKAGGQLVAVAVNPVDAVWTDQPPPPLGPVAPHAEPLAGRSSRDKRREIAEKLTSDGLDVAVIPAPDSIAWVFNLRGGDVPFAPLPLAFALLRSDETAELFVDPRKLTPESRESLGSGVRIHGPDALGDVLAELGRSGLRVGVDRDASPAWIAQRLRAGGAQVVWSADPCALPKSRKNAAELAGIRAAHRRDAAAMCRFLCWLSTAEGTVRESDAALRLEAFRRADPTYRGPSFPTIAGAGPNGAIVHYRHNEETDRPLERGSLFLIDSGAQYPDGTTDVTRTVAIGEPDADMRTNFTRVLKGHIALATARFPKGTTGSQLDVLARRPLWQAGLDYDHGTGHGVGCFLSVHEGPPRISKMPNRIALEPGMLLSNEPGYYKNGAYGIRIENLVIVQASDPEARFLSFDTITWVPIDRALVVAEMLSAEERAWLNGYHDRVREIVMPAVDAATRDWLARATRPI